MNQIKPCIYLFFMMIPFCNAYAASLIIGALSYNPPFEMQSSNTKTGDFFGFEIAIMKEICKRIQTQCTFKSVLFDQIPQQINSGEIDLAIGSIIITPERRQQFLFSLPFKESYIQYLTLAKANFTTVMSLSGKTLGVYKDSPAIPMAMKQFSTNIQIKYYQNSMDMLNALNSQEVDAVLTEDAQANYWIANNNGDYRMLGQPIPVGEGYGVMAKLDRRDLVAKINKALLDIETDGTYLSIYKGAF